MGGASLMSNTHFLPKKKNRVLSEAVFAKTFDYPLTKKGNLSVFSQLFCQSKGKK